jgi:hypothetical protein
MRFPRASNEVQVIELFQRRRHTWRMEIVAASGRRTFAKILLALIFFAATSVRPVCAGRPSPETVAAFEQYIRSKVAADARTVSDRNHFLVIDGQQDAKEKLAYARLRRGETLIESSAVGGSSPRGVPGRLIHDWTGLVFVPSISLRQALAALQDYAHDADYYRPQVLKSQLLEKSGDDFRVFLRLRQTRGIIVVLDTEYDVRYTELDATHADSHSYSTRIAEVQNPGQDRERDAPPADDRGFLWRLYSYWRFSEADGGVYIQCNAISLTRDIPVGLGWIVRPFIETIPRESLSFTLDATRKALASKFGAPSGPVQ